MGWKVQAWVLLLGAATLWAADGAQERIQVIARGAFSGIQEPKQIVITNQIQWAGLWEKHNARHEPKKPAPEIDFSRQTVLFVSLGRQRTGGYSVSITDVEKKDGKTEVTVKTTRPKPGGFQIQALTAPFSMVAVPKIEGPVEFKQQGS